MREALKPEDTRDGLRMLGGLVFGIGVLMLVLRKGEDWGDFPSFVLYVIPAVVLYGGALATVDDTGGLRPWQAVWSVFGLVFVPLALLQLVELVGGNPDASLNTFWVFAITAGLAFYAGIVIGVRFQILAGAIASLIAWSALWDELLGDGGIGEHITAYRIVLGVLAGALIYFGIRLWREDRDKGLERFEELLTGGGIAAVFAGGLGISAAVNLAPIPIPGFDGADTNVFWDLLLLAVSLVLIGAGTLLGIRGPTYVGAVGLAFFLFIVGFDLDSDSPEPTNLGIWPLALILVGGGAVYLSLTDYTLGDRPRQWVKSLRGR